MLQKIPPSKKNRLHTRQFPCRSPGRACSERTGSQHRPKSVRGASIFVALLTAAADAGGHRTENARRAQEAFQGAARRKGNRRLLRTDAHALQDLPRLASRIRIEDSHGKSLIPPPPPNAGPIDHLAALFKGLYIAVEGEAEGQRIEKAFAEHFENVTVVERIMEAKLDGFISKVLLGDESRVVRLLKSCNQSAIAPAVIELKVIVTATLAHLAACR